MMSNSVPSPRYVAILFLSLTAIAAVTMATRPQVLEGLPVVDCTNVTSPDPDAFLSLLMLLEKEGITHSTDTDLETVPYEILTAASLGELTEMLQDLGHIRLLRVLNGLTETYSNTFMKYMLSHLDAEYCAALQNSHS